MTRSALGFALRRYRKLAGLTQAQLAERTGFDPKTISRFETSTYTPSIDALMEFAQVLGVKPKDFFAEPDDEEEQRAYLFGVIHNAPPKDLGKLIAAVEQALAKP
ncbi:TPA: helix-turn-helix domain-containing protein [Pseudomonas putida]|jgi:transcriptional regulator with XRE-family HTH domain|uniref:Transcriptional regulator, XRE family n=1 Tax=Pseudomonas putida (strain GB-1) TaxID=76869 RepID=B0KJF1_PSEPG|nr:MULTISPECIES: helix-turn-helix domain-containing protein [Pseudomonas]ABY97790.1 transcriptional regulator, XRE family [Pseudomonas putida GB-1]APE98166.1 transcriptional regulator [Pseudomonas putida]MBP0710016.1 helix-turn-helix transcriptional regulator [Pseudomonas sp. T34]MCE1003504.1 helix-turn-helix domain-containing protein [Pseudomonas sp. NMI1173_11]MCK2189463.1 helix-turn-helix domain-containing protein [Pseudomonas sp. MB04B]